ncbi:MAG: 23S rRNA (pseudouridine(1915)-N(3))-methyltransferase RlmH [Bacilli bacterium]|nr:23S rRNA (pseudouridine(1915)-N(3))-methyltransferase RlmH [Bacilli bacterium]
MKIKIISVGKLKEKYLVDGVNEYIKRLGAYTKVEVYEVADEKIPNNPSLADESLVKVKEGRRVLDKVKQDDYMILLDVQGKKLDSIKFSKHIENLMIDGKSSIVFVIGGSLGHCQEVYDRANYKLSFSDMTFPHQLMKLMLVEQIYRAFKIINNETYHK